MVDNMGLIMKENWSHKPSREKIPVERRSGIDRRKRDLRAVVFRAGPRRRRSAGRRKTDTGGYVDIYDLRTWCITIAVLLFSLVDAVLTGFHILRGSATELNPVMKAVLNRGGLTAFFLIKAMMTVVPMAVIMLHKEWILGRYAARLCLLAYILVSLYHVYLIFVLRPFSGYFIAGT